MIRARCLLAFVPFVLVCAASDSSTPETENTRSVENEAVETEQMPVLDPDTRHENPRFGYTLLGWESKADRFWVVTSGKVLDSEENRNSRSLASRSR